MAKQAAVYLGYEEEFVGDKNHTLLNHTVNKIGGYPDWPPSINVQFSSKCPLCGLNRLLVVQCYAPLENSVYHRTLYVFACVNPNCWIQSESWTCVRAQVLDQTCSENPLTATSVAMPIADSNLQWCNGADEWDENDNGDAANGNLMNVDNACGPNNIMQRSSDEDDESNSFEVATVEQALGNLQVCDAHNANMSPVQGAVGALGAPAAAAELEGGDEPGLVSVDTPTAPADLQTVLQQTAELPGELRSRLLSGQVQFVPKYIYVEEELKKPSKGESDDHVIELLNQYKRTNGDEMQGEAGGVNLAAGAGASGDEEAYEEAAPLHGDRLFHAFLTRLRANPGQILRYSRDAPPLLGAPLSNVATTPESAALPGSCSRCGASMVCELQLLPAFAATLQIAGLQTQMDHLQFLSVLIFTCAQSCWSADDFAVVEAVVFQPEVF